MCSLTGLLEALQAPAHLLEHTVHRRAVLRRVCVDVEARVDPIAEGRSGLALQLIHEICMRVLRGGRRRRPKALQEDAAPLLRLNVVVPLEWCLARAHGTIAVPADVFFSIPLVRVHIPPPWPSTEVRE